MNPPIPSSERYDAALSVFCGLNEPENLRVNRKRLLGARDWAARRISNPYGVHPEALNLYYSVHEHAARWCYALSDTAKIERAVWNCLRLSQVASTIESMEAAYNEVG